MANAKETDLITRLEQKAHRIELEAFSGDYEASRREATAQMANLLREAANAIKGLHEREEFLSERLMARKAEIKHLQQDRVELIKYYEDAIFEIENNS